MNKRTLSDDQNDNEKNKTGVKRYLMSSDDHFEKQKLNYEKNCDSKLNYNSSNETKENDNINDMNNNHGNNKIDSNSNNNTNTNMNSNSSSTNNSTLTTSNNNNSNNNNNSYSNNNNSNNNSYNNNNNNNNNNNSNNNNNNNNNSSSNKYYSNDCKKRKGRYSMPFLKKEKNNVSTILILTNVPKDADEEDIKSFMRPFIKNKIPEINFCDEEIIVKLYDDELNENMYNYFNEHPTQIKGSFVKVKLSKISDDNKGNLDTYETSSNNNNNSKEKLEKKNSKHNKNECSKVILVSVINLHYPVDIELIYYLFSKCGVVEKIITFSRNPVVYQALVQFKNIETAKEAIKTLHNRNIYDGCNTIQIQYSFLKELVVKANNSSSWDYTTTSASKNKGFSNFQSSHGVLPTPTRKNKDSELYHLMERKFKLVDFETKNPSKTPVLICYNIPKEYTDVNKLFNLFSVYGFVSRIKILREKPDSALIQYSNYLYSSLAQECLQHAKICDQTIELHFSKIHDIRISSQQKKNESYKAKSFNNYDQRYLVADQVKYIKGACKPTKTLFISNVNEEVNEECIVNLFNKYGEINKLKFQPIKEGKKHLMITVEMNSEDMATRALMDLHNHYIKDRAIKVSFTKTRLL
ncbi:polypyrimidine tract binding protein, putative [Plasmodium relictum]|uniref:Polypyrimidine tract binding protein, putative n=1 Tax=Plasmodium relictum TaxID=85471 RepID=A0A1J1H8U9_PLARL|nr:polypyrimidine tract binding protein, putative [Plasmodium relictum]CRH01069.1 polypyrimidine tract binding protein, putative [Plasmodium relictum]